MTIDNGEVIQWDGAAKIKEENLHGLAGVRGWSRMDGWRFLTDMCQAPVLPGSVFGLGRDYCLPNVSKSDNGASSSTSACSVNRVLIKKLHGFFTKSKTGVEVWHFADGEASCPRITQE